MFWGIIKWGAHSPTVLPPEALPLRHTQLRLQQVATCMQMLRAAICGHHSIFLDFSVVAMQANSCKSVIATHVFHLWLYPLCSAKMSATNNKAKENIYNSPHALQRRFQLVQKSDGVANASASVHCTIIFQHILHVNVWLKFLEQNRSPAKAPQPSLWLIGKYQWPNDLWLWLYPWVASQKSLLSNHYSPGLVAWSLWLLVKPIK